MELFKRWRSDKKFRMNFVIGVVLFLVILTNAPEKKEATAPTFAQCDAWNNPSASSWLNACPGDWLNLPTQCKAEYAVFNDKQHRLSIGYTSDETKSRLNGCKNTKCGIIFIGDSVTKKSAYCINSVPDTYTTITPEMCAHEASTTWSLTGCWESIGSGDKCYTCTPKMTGTVAGLDPSERLTCTKGLKPFSSLYTALLKDKGGLDCDMQAYITIGAITLIVLAVI